MDDDDYVAKVEEEERREAEEAEKPAESKDSGKADFAAKLKDDKK